MADPGRTRTIRIAALVAAAMVGCLLPAVSASAAVTGSIAGVVTGPDGMPVEHAEVDVYVRDQSGNTSVVGGGLTDSTGTYKVPDLQPGDYLVLFGSLVDMSLASEWYDDAPDVASADVVHVADGTNVTGIDAQLAAAALITGRLTTPTGVGVDDGRVEAYRLGAGGQIVGVFAAARTGPDGSYEIDALPPGTYLLHFFDFTQGVGEFWDNKTSFEAADHIVLAAGQQRTGVDAILGTPAPPLPAIVNTQLPQVSGAKAPQVGYPMSLSNGSWTPSYVGVSAQWLINSQPIPGAFYGMYTPTLADLGKTLTVRVTASLPGYASATVTTLPTLPVSKLVQSNLRPWLKGTAKVGERLKVKPGVWRPLFVVTFKYRWYADGHRIRGAGDDRLQLTSALKGTNIVCRVTGSAPGLDPLAVRTRASAKVTR